MPDIIDLAALRATPLLTDPYDHVCVPGFIRKERLAEIHSDYPAISTPGSIPVGIFPHGPMFEKLLSELRGPEIEQVFEEKFSVALSRYPRMFTVRGMCRHSDGAVHPDSASKVITVLIYMNPPWEASGGRLRLLRSTNLNDYVSEVPPVEGTLLAFRRSDTSWHGHEPFEGQRRAIQMNWVKGRVYIWHEQWRHRLGAWSKLLLGGKNHM
ncbi:2OG-FeII_Oxy_3 domain-containing protein [Azospirillaceae bacterium]